jgi:flavin reductase (DIM6/NTAB) family NADH-FMN oxidoreductase RutF
METSNKVPVATEFISSVSPVLGKLPSGMFVVTTRNGERETGMLSSWVMQAGFNPPAITIAVRQNRYVAEWLTQRCAFVLNLLEQGQTQLLRYFSRGFPPDERPFDSLNVDRTANGIPILRDTLGYLECEPRLHVDSGDHRIFMAVVTGGNLATSCEPMVHIRRSGMHY